MLENLSFDEIEKRLELISNKIIARYPEQYNSKFLSLVKILVEKLGIKLLLRGERRLYDSNDIKIKSNPLDLIIFIEENKENLDYISQTFKNEFSSKISLSKTDNRLMINFENERIVYSIINVSQKEFNYFTKYFKVLPNNMDFLNKAIILLNFWNEKANNKLYYPYQIEYIVISNKIDKLLWYIEIFSDIMDEDNIEIIKWLLVIVAKSFGGDDLMAEEERLLTKLANKLAQESQDKYDSCFISVVNTLHNNMQVSEITRGGSRAKLTYNIGMGDLDIIFTYVKPTLSTEEIFKKTERILRGNFDRIAQITPKKVAINLKFNEDIELDVVYLPYNDYIRNVLNLEKVRTADKMKRDAIRLIKYWNEVKNYRSIKPMHIESVILGWNYSSLYTYITQYGDYRDLDMQILNWLLQKSKAI